MALPLACIPISLRFNAQDRKLLAKFAANALFVGTRMINVRFAGITGESYYSETWVICLVQKVNKHQRQLARLIGVERQAEMIRREEARVNLLREWTDSNDGHSCGRVGRLIEDMMEAKTAMPAAGWDLALI